MRCTGKEWPGCLCSHCSPEGLIYSTRNGRFELNTWKGHTFVQHEGPCAASPVATVSRAQWRKGKWHDCTKEQQYHTENFIFCSSFLSVNKLTSTPVQHKHNLPEFRSDEISVQPATEKRDLNGGPQAQGQVSVLSKVTTYKPAVPRRVKLHPPACCSAPKQGVFSQTSLSATVLPLTPCSHLIPQPYLCQDNCWYGHTLNCTEENNPLLPTPTKNKHFVEIELVSWSNSLCSHTNCYTGVSAYVGKGGQQARTNSKWMALLWERSGCEATASVEAKPGPSSLPKHI